MRKLRQRVSYAESLKAYKALEQRIIKGYPDVGLARDRTTLVGVLLKLADQLAAGLSELAGMPMPAGRDSTTAFLKADPPIATLRAFRVEMLDQFCEGIRGAAEDPEVAKLRARLAKEPDPGREIIAAGNLLVWFVQWYLFIQLQVEAASTSGLPSHDIDTHVEEAARAEISMAGKDQTLAHMKEAIDEAIRRGVPEDAARAFLMGHIQIPLAIVLKSSNPFSRNTSPIPATSGTSGPTTVRSIFSIMRMPSSALPLI